MGFFRKAIPHPCLRVSTAFLTGSPLVLNCSRRCRTNKHLRRQDNEKQDGNQGVHTTTFPLRINDST